VTSEQTSVGTQKKLQRTLENDSGPRSGTLASTSPKGPQEGHAIDKLSPRWVWSRCNWSHGLGQSRLTNGKKSRFIGEYLHRRVTV